MKNLTLSVDEESYRTARIVAARQNTSVSELVRNYFKSLEPACGQDPITELFAVMDEVGSSAAAANRERDRSKLYDR